MNPPVHAWSTIFTYRLEAAANGGTGDLDWLERLFQKLLINFTWWVNRKDRDGSNLFEGGFLGLDNIGVFDRSKPLPTGGYLEQADGTAWMALFCQNMVEIASELAMERPAYAEMAEKFVAHFLWIATAMMHAGHGTGCGTRRTASSTTSCACPDGTGERLKVRSMVGLLPLCAVTSFSGALLETYPEIAHRLTRFLEARPELRELHPRPRRARRDRPPADVDPRRAQAPARPRPDARRGRVPVAARDPLAVALPRGPPVLARGRRGRVRRRLPARPSPTAGCSAATPTGGARSGCRSTRSSSGR